MALPKPTRLEFLAMKLFTTAAIAALLLVCADAALRPGVVAPAEAVVAPQSPSTCTRFEVVRQGRIPMPEGVPAAHASTLVAFSAQHPLSASKSLAALWFAGTRESAPDVQIAMATFDRQRQAWDAPQWVVSRESLRAALGVQIRRIGNPVAWSDAHGRLHVFVVATGLGGWAASRVVHLREVQTLSAAQKAPQFEVERILPLMPQVPSFNTSVLVRAAPLALADGGAVLPLYFEINTKYPLALRLSPTGDMLGLTRMSERKDVLQPSIVAVSPTQWLAFMRHSAANGQVALTQSMDAGQHWQDLPSTAIHAENGAPLGNPDSSVAALNMGGQIWLAHNPLERRREVLQLSRVPLELMTAFQANHNSVATASTELNPNPWHTQDWVAGNAGDEFSYPSLITVPVSGQAQPEVWLSYTDQRRDIAFQQLRVHCEATP